MSGSTVVGPGHPTAVKLYSRYVFNKTVRQNGFTNKLIGPAPKQSKAERKAKMQSSSDYPFVRINDLAKTSGERITIDLYHEIDGKPVMGDRELVGKEQDLTSDTMEVLINQSRHAVSAGGKMSRKRTLHNLRSMAAAKEVGWRRRYEDQCCLVHVAGARGDDNGEDWVVPLESDPDFADIVVNQVVPPSVNRRFFGGDATSVANVDAADVLSLDTFDALRLTSDEDVFPMTPVMLQGDMGSDENDLYIYYATPRQWNQLLTATTPQNWRTFVASAEKRASMVKHPLFTGEIGMWRNILIKKLKRPVTFSIGSNVSEYDGAGVIQQVNPAVKVDRGILLGSEALAIAHGMHESSGYYYHWEEELTDYKNKLGIGTAGIDGKAKIRFKSKSGVITDHGVRTVDTYGG